MVQGDIALRWAGILLLTSISYFAIKLYQQRVWFRRTVKKYNLVSYKNLYLYQKNTPF